MSLEGRLEDLGLGDIFQIISLSSRSGVLTLIRKEGTARLVFNSGKVIFASSDSASRLGFTLVQKGIISNEDLEYALRAQKGRGSTKPLGSILVEMEALSVEVLERELKYHVIIVVKDLLAWKSGSFHFELNPPVDTDISAGTGFSTEYLLLEASRQRDEESREIRKAAALEKKPAPTARAAQNRVEDLERTQVQPAEIARPSAKPSVSKVSDDEAERTDPSLRSPSGPSRGISDRRDLVLLPRMTSELAKYSSSSEITLLVLRFASELLSRAVIFLVKKNEIVGLGQFGLRLDTDPQEYIKTISIPLSGSSLLKTVVETRSGYKGALDKTSFNKDLLDRLGGGWPKEALIVPLLCDDRVVALLYADNLPDQRSVGETEGFEAFIRISGVSLGKALLERKLSQR